MFLDNIKETHNWKQLFLRSKLVKNLSLVTGKIAPQKSKFSIYFNPDNVL